MELGLRMQGKKVTVQTKTFVSPKYSELSNIPNTQPFFFFTSTSLSGQLLVSRF